MFDVAPIGPIAYSDWLRIGAPSLSSFSVVCVFCHLSCRVATGGSVIWEKAQGANALIPPSVDGYVHILPNFLDPKERCG